MQQHETPLIPNHFYHIYNRGINGENLFHEEKNYIFFLEKYAHYLEPVTETFAYCLLKNHFHLLIRVRPEKILQAFYEENTVNPSNSGVHSSDRLVSKQFSKLFSSFAQSINKMYGRTGSLFEKPFRRKLVEHDSYFTRLVHYIHANPVHHGFTDDYTTYPHSSYNSLIDKRATRLQRQEVLVWFGNRHLYIDFHRKMEIGKPASWMIE